MGSQGVAYWNVNVPAAEHTESCPDFLARVNDKDRGILSTPDAEFRLHSWPEVTAMIRANRLEDFQRVPSDLRRYKAFTYDLVRRHGSVAAFILGHRLGWEAPVVPRGRPFEHPDDMRILHNDWPYGIDPRIVHLVVWTKFVLEEDPATGDISDQTRREIENYMAETFYVRIPKSRVIWFKNWGSLKSVRAVEHFHVMMYDPDPDFVDSITNGDVPMSRRPGI